jgi:hypothetical protein
MYSELKLIEQAVINNQFEVINELWAGADQEVKLPCKGCRSGKGMTYHKEAYAISTLVYKLKDIIPYDYLDKFELFERLLTDLPKDNVLLEMIDRAKTLFWERSDSRPYLAYGSNMDRDQMKDRCPKE